MKKFALMAIAAVALSSSSWATFSKPLNYDGTETRIWRHGIMSVAAKRVCTNVLENWEYANADEKISTDSKFWEAKHVKIKNGNGLKVNTPCLVRTKEKGTWAEALEDLLKNKGKLECTIFLSTVKLCALVDYMGADIFEKYVGHFKSQVAPLYSIEAAGIFHELGEYLMCDGGMGQPQVGSTYYLTSFELYPHFKPNGNDRGHNLVCVRSKPELFVGFSDLFKTGPKSRAAILKELWQGFASEGDVECHKEKHGQMVSAFSSQPGLFEEYCSKQQAKLPGPQYIDGDKVVEIVKML